MRVLSHIGNILVVVLAFAIYFGLGYMAGFLVAGQFSIARDWLPVFAAVLSFFGCMSACVTKPAEGVSVLRSMTRTDDTSMGAGALGGMALGFGSGSGLASSSLHAPSGMSADLSNSTRTTDTPIASVKFSEINPATGLPMMSDSPAGLDVGGNMYGTTSTTDSFGGSSMDYGSSSSSGALGSEPW